ncbi:MAG: hypothetical protein ACR2NU_04605 [Aeoliella sp.]
MDRTDIILLVVGTVIAVSALLRLMLARRDLLVGQVKGQIQQQRRKPKVAKQEEEAA